MLIIRNSNTYVVRIHLYVHHMEHRTLHTIPHVHCTWLCKCTLIVAVDLMSVTFICIEIRKYRGKNSRIIYDLHPYASKLPSKLFFSFSLFHTTHKVHRLMSHTNFKQRQISHQIFLHKFATHFFFIPFNLTFTLFMVHSSFQTLKYPKSVAFIISNEFCERFNYYGMRSEYIINLISVEGGEKLK